ncbi:hypothetical protein [Propioniciclava flava]
MPLPARRCCNELGFSDLDALTAAALPAEIAMEGPLDLPAARSEAEVQADLMRMAQTNQPGRAMIGLGYYGTLTPAVIRRNILENPALVHRLHPLPARDQPGAAGDAAHLPNDDR